MILHGDCLDKLKELSADSVDALVTDPPAGISFMGKSWDGDKGGRKVWCAWLESVMRECLRVMKPGAHGLAWALPRTSHWTGAALEDAGFEIRDCVYHLFGSGFPKSLDVSKAIDKAAGAAFKNSGDYKITAPATDAAKQWQGFGTALKPAVECWWLVRKPLSEKTVAKNVLRWGTGALNVGGSRIATQDNLNGGTYSKNVKPQGKSQVPGNGIDRDFVQPTARFPSHLLLSCACPYDTQHELGCAVRELDGQSGALQGAGNKSLRSEHKTSESKFGMGGGAPTVLYDRGGGASRFFYCAKVSASERNAGLEGMPKGEAPASARSKPAPGREAALGQPRANHHPTVKPQKLMRYLARLITPPGGTVLDPFTGSGSTGVACVSEGFEFIGIERESEYVEIAKKRIAHVSA